jgi:hypothetical protein
MIEMVNSRRHVDAAVITGKYLVMSLPLSGYKNIFPGTPVFVQNAENSRARMHAWPVKAHFSENGVCQDIRIMQGSDCPMSIRLEPFDGFICDNEADVVALMNVRNDIENIISSNAGYVSDAVIARELEALYSDVIGASKPKPVVHEAEKVYSKAA